MKKEVIIGLIVLIALLFLLAVSDNTVEEADAQQAQVTFEVVPAEPEVSEGVAEVQFEVVDENENE